MSPVPSRGTVHAVPKDLQRALMSNIGACKAWEKLTPLARNEWICWVTFVKKAETRAEHVVRVVSQLNAGKRRPCCWIGCPHRDDKPLSPSVRGILEKRSKKK